MGPRLYNRYSSPARRVGGYALWLCIGLHAAAWAANGPSTPEEVRRRLDSAERDQSAALAAQRAASERAASASALASRMAAELSAARARLAEAKQATRAAADQMSALARSRAEAEQRVAERMKALEPLLPVLERLSRYPAETMLAIALPPEDAMRGAMVVRALAQEITDRAASLRQEQQGLKAAEGRMAAAAPGLAAAEAAQAAAAADLDRQLAAAEASRNVAENEAAAASRRVAELTAEASQLKAMITKLEAGEEKAAARRGARKVAMTVPARPSGGSAPGRLLVPVSGSVIRGYGQPTEAGPAVGISYRGQSGAAVVAPCAGRIMFAAPFRSYGQLLILSCGGGIDAVLAGFGQINAKPGEMVQAGSALGTLPDTGTPLLYLEVRRGGDPVDPKAWLHSSG